MSQPYQSTAAPPLTTGAAWVLLYPQGVALGATAASVIRFDTRRPTGPFRCLVPVFTAEGRAGRFAANPVVRDAGLVPHRVAGPAALGALLAEMQWDGVTHVSLDPDPAAPMPQPVPIAEVVAGLRSQAAG